MNEKKYREVFPCGTLVTPTGRKFWLLSPHPVVKDWERDELYRFVVVPYDPVSSSGNTHLYSYSRHLITPAPEIEYKYLSHTGIHIEDLQESQTKQDEKEVYERNLPEEATSCNEPDWFGESLELAIEAVMSVGE